MAPVVFVVFNRPDETRISFAEIRRRRPEQLFIVADGPRPGHPTDDERCAEVRSIVSAVDWPCDVRRNYEERNLGCKQRVSSGLDWVFSQTDRAIVIEDDCVPHPEFFAYCDALLDRYAQDARVVVVNGNNYQSGHQRGDGSYYFSRYIHVWGWATWKRAWDLYDGDMSFWPQFRASDEWRGLFPDRVERRHWTRVLDRALKIDTWDYPWVASLWHGGGLAATPNTNLVTNIGFNENATHTTKPTASANAPMAALGQIHHPESVELDPDADRSTFDGHFGGRSLRARRRPLGFLWWLVVGVARVIRTKLLAVARRSP